MATNPITWNYAIISSLALIASSTAIIAETMQLEITNHSCRMGYCDAQFFIANEKIDRCRRVISSVNMNYVDPVGGDLSELQRGLPPTAVLSLDKVDCCRRLLNGKKVPANADSNADVWAVDLVNSVCR